MVACKVLRHMIELGFVFFRALSFSLLLVAELGVPFANDPIRGAKNLVRLLYKHESWASVNTLRDSGLNLEDKWVYLLSQRSRVVMHALGDYSRRNSLAGVSSSAAKGAEFFEVDIFLDESGRLRCHHGPEYPEPYQAGDCEFALLLSTLPQNSFLILDVKTNFVTTANEVLKELSQKEMSESRSKVIFQLYLPSHLRWFVEAGRRHPDVLRNKPIVTLYRTHSYAPFVSLASPDFVGAITYPWSRLDMKSLESFLFKVNKPLLTHAISDCNALMDAIDSGVVGIYGPNTLLDCHEFSQYNKLSSDHDGG